MKNKYLKLVICIIVVLIAFFYYQNNSIVITKFVYTSTKVESDLDGYKIVQISDLHNKKFGKDNKVLIKKIRKSKPNIIVLTGDLIDSNHTDIETALNFVKKAKEIAPTYFVTGNHECALSQNKYNQLLKGLQRCGAILMDGKEIKLFKNSYLVGIGDDSLKEITSKLPNDSMNILLAHEPQLLADYAKAKTDIVLCGHAHGGQIRIPFCNIGLIAPDQGLFPKYTSGKYEKGETTMYVSRGLGNSILPLRIFNQPEIIEIVLKKK
ncbi:MAG: metallophosphoesterase [Anaerostipes sp.]|nr:metallophosphoesterase [Anaerostipes sp.]MDD3747404.1 metallophosphoesterase [Anaerostipes sp.]